MIYTTGELAKACKVSVRTVQYYDQKQLLKPDFVENQRRYYNDEGKLQLDIIVTLKEMNFSLKEIKTLLEEPGSIKTLKLLVQQKEEELALKIAAEQEKLAQIKRLNTAMSQQSEEPISNVLKFNQISEGMNQMKQFRRNLIISAGVVGAIQYGSIFLAIQKHDFKPVGIVLPFLFAYGAGVTWLYYQNVSYVCPNCQHTFKPSLKEVILANHTFKTRKLKCPACKETHYCVEVLDGSNKVNNKQA